MPPPDNLDIATKLVHAGERRGTPIGVPAAVPIYATSTFLYDTMAEVDKVFAGEIPGYIYTRYGNPTVAALEEALRELETGAAACAYASGMAALHAALVACELGSGATVLASQDLYGATLNLLQQVFAGFGVETVTADFSNLAALEQTAREVRPRVLIAETISNPLLKVCDLDACAAIAQKAGARLIIDNTFATPYLCRPLEHGADFVVHSATKYLGGHADVMGGIVVAREQTDQAALVGVMKLVGGILGPWEAHEILRGVKTLAVRMERQCGNARWLAERLAQDARIARVHYPALRPDTQPVLQRTLRSPHAGAMVSVELRENTREAAFAFMDALRLCVRSTSLGDVFTSVLHPATASHREMAPARRKQLGISDGLVRFSVGIESVDDIWADIQQALSLSASPAKAAITQPPA
ncbi:MAG TPA: PLP-dependent aspartate aminotransferase family protein [Terriglobales bacterium]|nr:PLP-dependent aspartate aminotransferase family protein [Terriglobales bacterium]